MTKAQGIEVAIKNHTIRLRQYEATLKHIDKKLHPKSYDQVKDEIKKIKEKLKVLSLQ